LGKKTSEKKAGEATFHEKDRKRMEVFEMGNRPIKKFRAGNIEAAIWFNEREVDGQIVGFKTVTLSRGWKDKKENLWRNEVVNLRKGDLPKALLVLSKANEEVLLKDDAEGGD